MIIIAGLGNPGSQYAGNRHNIGFMAVDAIADKNRFSPLVSAKFKGLISEGNLAGEKVLLVKPQTYMNLSGESGRARQCVSTKCRLPTSSSFMTNSISFPARRGSRPVAARGGHNGIKSIDAHCGKELPAAAPRHRPSRLERTCSWSRARQFCQIRRRMA